jgi:hypothetical protein
MAVKAKAQGVGYTRKAWALLAEHRDGAYEPRLFQVVFRTRQAAMNGRGAIGVAVWAMPPEERAKAELWRHRPIRVNVTVEPA